MSTHISTVIYSGSKQRDRSVEVEESWEHLDLPFTRTPTFRLPLESIPATATHEVFVSRVSAMEKMLFEAAESSTSDVHTNAINRMRSVVTELPGSDSSMHTGSMRSSILQNRRTDPRSLIQWTLIGPSYLLHLENPGVSSPCLKHTRNTQNRSLVDR